MRLRDRMTEQSDGPQHLWQFSHPSSARSRRMQGRLVRPFNAGNCCHAEGNRSVCRDCIGHGVVHREVSCHPADSRQFRRSGGCRPRKSPSSHAAMRAAGWTICDAGHRLAKMARSPRQGIRRKQWRCTLLRSRGERLLLQRILFVLGAGADQGWYLKTLPPFITNAMWRSAVASAR
jgi:hypothetical protein